MSSSSSAGARSVGGGKRYDGTGDGRPSDAFLIEPFQAGAKG